MYYNIYLFKRIIMEKYIEAYGSNTRIKKSSWYS